MTIKEDIEKIIQLMKQKLKITEIPENGEECIVIREQVVEKKSYVPEVAVGKIWKYERYFNVMGMVYNEDYNSFTDSSLKIDTKNRQKSIRVIVGVVPSGFIRTMDESKWNNKFKTLEDLIRILGEL